MNFYCVLQNLWLSYPVEGLLEKEKNNVLFGREQRAATDSVVIKSQLNGGRHYYFSAQWTLADDLKSFLGLEFCSWGETKWCYLRILLQQAEN